MSDVSEESDLELQDSIIHTRTRRANAGSRMKTLLAASAPQEDDEDEMFKEVENDGEFDLTAYKQVKREVGASDFSSDSEISEDDKDLDEGERALAKQQRQAKKDQRRRDREKMFKIKTHAPPRPAKKRKMERTTEDTIEILMADTRRASQRRSAIDNRQRTIERLRENERKRAEYVTPVYRKKVKLTQAQRLAEAKITEEKNTASLHNFVEMEEQRKYQQHMALLGKRKRLTNFIRFVSRSIYEYPVPTEVPPMPYQGYSAPPSSSSLPSSQATQPVSAGEPTTPAAAPSPAAATTYQYNPRGQLYAGLDDDNDAKPVRTGQLGQIKAVKSGQLAGQLGQIGKVGQLGQLGASKTGPDTASHRSDSAEPVSKSLETSPEPEPEQNQELDRQSQPAEEQTPDHETDTGATPLEEPVKQEQPDAEELNTEEPGTEEPDTEERDTQKPDTEEHKDQEPEQSGDTKAEINETMPKQEGDGPLEEIEEIRECAGPPAIKAFNNLTLEEFNFPVNNKLVARGLILGENNVKPPSFPPKRICPFTGEIAKYIDPQTGIAYLNIHIYRLIKRVRNHEYVWSSGAGGVYTQPWAGQRHAKGVPPGFEDAKDLPEPSAEIKKELEQRKSAQRAQPSGTPSGTPNGTPNGATSGAGTPTTPTIKEEPEPVEASKS